MKRLALVASLAILTSLSALAASPVKIDFLSPFDYGGPTAGTLEHLVGMFNETHPNIHVTHIGHANVWDRITVGVAGGAPPNVAWTTPLAPELLHETTVVPMQELAKRAGLDASVFWPLLWGGVSTYRGIQWGYPFEVGSQALIYNNDEFLKAGIGSPSATKPMTWSQYLTIAKKVNRPEQGIFAIQESYESWNTRQVMLRNGSDIISTDNKTATFMDPGVIEALDWYAGLSVAHNLTGGWLPSGTAVMHTEHPGWYSMMKETAAFEFGTAPPPIQDEGGVRGSTSYYKELVILRTTRNEEDASWDFVHWLMSPEQNAVWASGTGYLPVRKDVLATQRYRRYLAENPRILPWLDELDHLSPSTRECDTLMGYLQDATNMVLSGQYDARTALASVVDAAQARLDQYRQQVTATE